MKKSLTHIGIALLTILITKPTMAVPAVTGSPLIIDYVGSIDWPEEPEEDPTVPFLSQGDANKNYDLHGEVSCDVIISTPGNYHMALNEAMRGHPDLIGFAGLATQIKQAYGLTTCWTTSPPVNEEQIPAERLRFTNVDLIGRPILAMGPGGKMNNLRDKGLIDNGTRHAFLKNRGNAMLVRADKAARIKNVCDLAQGGVRLVTPRPNDGSGAQEPGSFGNFSGTIYNTAVTVGCLDPDGIFNRYFAQDLSRINLNGLNNAFDHQTFMATYRQQNLTWVASSRIMHRDQPYALCNDMADVGVIFYHQALYLQQEMAAIGCDLVIVPFAPGGTVPEEQLGGNRIGTLEVAHVTDPNAIFTVDQIAARDLIYSFLKFDPVWDTILLKYGMYDPAP